MTQTLFRLIKNNGMKKKAKETKTGKKIVTEKPKQMPREDETTSGRDDEKPFDFGGIPDRDLKKNLGCG